MSENDNLTPEADLPSRMPAMRLSLNPMNSPKVRRSLSMQ